MLCWESVREMRFCDGDVGVSDRGELVGVIEVSLLGGWGFVRIPW